MDLGRDGDGIGTMRWTIVGVFRSVGLLRLRDTVVETTGIVE